MVCLIFFFSAILAILAQGEEESNCTNTYYTVNNFRTERAFNFSCYGVDSNDCEVFYSPPGVGCNGTSELTLIGTVPDNETQVLTSNIDLQFGGGFCSDYQIGVYYVDNATSYIVAHLPKATEAGTKFQAAMYSDFKTVPYECTISALELRVEGDLFNEGINRRFAIDPYKTFKFYFKVKVSTKNLLSVVSNNDVIVACVGDGSPKRLTTLQPISSQPLFINTRNSGILTVILSDCTTNELATNLSKFNLVYMRENGNDCRVTQIYKGAVDMQIFDVFDRCTFYIQPLDNLCLSVGWQAGWKGIKRPLTAVGIPQNKFGISFVHYPDLPKSILFSLSQPTCDSFVDNQVRATSFLLWENGVLNGKVASTLVNSFVRFDRMECDGPVLLVSDQGPFRYPFLSAYQRIELWEPFFARQCGKIPSSLVPSEEISTSLPVINSTSSSNPVLSNIGWITFFGVHFFYYVW